MDISRANNSQSNKSVPQICIRCNFCNSSISPNANNRKILNILSKPRATCCPNCNKSCSRCALCLLPMGSNCDYPLTNIKKSVGPSTLFDFWFTWCQLCGHGGHSKHIYEWFEEHHSCPVSDCACICRG